MSIDLIVGFEKLPHDFEAFIREWGFRFESRQDLSDSGVASTYSYFENGKSARGVWITFNNSTERDDTNQWRKIAGDSLITATAIVWTPMSRNGFDLAKQRQMSSVIKERYHALIYDPQVARLLELKDLECWPREPGRQDAPELLRRTPPPAVTSGRPGDLTPPQCSPLASPEGPDEKTSGQKDEHRDMYFQDEKTTQFPLTPNAPSFMQTTTVAALKKCLQHKHLARLRLAHKSMAIVP